MTIEPVRVKVDWRSYDWWSGLIDTDDEFWVHNRIGMCAIIFAQRFESWGS